jgi:hypothetical protein
MEIVIKKMLRLENSKIPMHGESIEIFGVEFIEKVIPPKVFVFETETELNEGFYNEITFKYNNLQYTLESTNTRRKSDNLYVIECLDFKFKMI